MDLQSATQRTRPVSIMLFLISLLLPCFASSDGNHDSLNTLAIGWLGVICGGSNLVWLANPLLIMSWISYNRKAYSVATVAGFLASAIAFSFLFCQGVAFDEGGGQHPILGYKIGYWLWLGSCIVMLSGSFVMLWIQTKEAGRG